MSRFVNPVPEYKPNSKLFFYKSGTNTQLVTYADELQSIPNPQPVLCDSAGNTPNIFYSGSAKLIVLDENNVQYIERDPVGGEKELGDFTLWDTTVSYDQNDIVEGSNGKFYISLSNGNQANDPTTSPVEWSEIRFIGVWNTNVVYAIGNVVQSNSGLLWRAITATAGNNPASDDGTNWLPAVDGSKIPEVAQNTLSWVSVTKTDGDTIERKRVNLINDGGTFNLPLASEVPALEFLIISQQQSVSDLQPLIVCAGSDTILIDGGGSDTEILFDNTVSREIRLISSGTTLWGLSL